MRLISWNIQWCRGIDGRVDPARIAQAAKDLCDPDVCCFQEVSENYDSLAGSSGENQPELLKKLFKFHGAHFACAVDVADGTGGRRRFGNLILSRLPVQRVLRHSLPWLPEDNVPSMPRIAIEAIVEAPWGPVSVTTTHLEYYSALQRAAQVGRLCEIEAERNAHARSKPSDAYSSGPFQPMPRPASSILTGDFNMRPGDPQVARILETRTDAWRAVHPGTPHPPTFCVHDKEDESPYCCDFVFVTKDLVPRISSVRVDGETQASDHQPLIVEFN